MVLSKRTAVLLAAGVLILLTGCMSPLLMSPASTPLEGRSYVTTGKTTGEACMFSILGIPFATDASLASALKNAKDMASADALIDIVVDSRYVYTFFYNRSCTVVRATGIRFTSAPAPYLPPAPAVPAVPPIPPAPGVKETPEEEKEEVEPPPAPEVKPAVPAKPKKMTRAEKRKAEREAKRKAAEEKKRAEEEARKKALAKKQTPAEKPIPAQYKSFCRYQEGDQIRIETKTEVITGEFLKCAHFGIQIKPPDKPRGVVPFEQIWMINLVGAAKPEVTPIAPIEPAPATPAEPAQPRKPAIPK